MFDQPRIWMARAALPECQIGPAVNPGCLLVAEMARLNSFTQAKPKLGSKYPMWVGFGAPEIFVSRLRRS